MSWIIEHEITSPDFRGSLRGGDTFVFVRGQRVCFQLKPGPDMLTAAVNRDLRRAAAWLHKFKLIIVDVGSGQRREVVATDSAPNMVEYEFQFTGEKVLRFLGAARAVERAPAMTPSSAGAHEPLHPHPWFPPINIRFEAHVVELNDFLDITGSGPMGGAAATTRGRWSQSWETAARDRREAESRSDPEYAALLRLRQQRVQALRDAYQRNERRPGVVVFNFRTQGEFMHMTGAQLEDYFGRLDETVAAVPALDLQSRVVRGGVRPLRVIWQIEREPHTQGANSQVRVFERWLFANGYAHPDEQARMDAESRRRSQQVYYADEMLKVRLDDSERPIILSAGDLLSRRQIADLENTLDTILFVVDAFDIAVVLIRSAARGAITAALREAEREIAASSVAQFRRRILTTRGSGRAARPRASSRAIRAVERPANPRALEPPLGESERGLESPGTGGAAIIRVPSIPEHELQTVRGFRFSMTESQQREFAQLLRQSFSSRNPITQHLREIWVAVGRHARTGARLPGRRELAEAIQEGEAIGSLSKALFNNTRKRFWRRVRGDRELVRALRNAGLHFGDNPESPPFVYLLRHDGTTEQISLDLAHGAAREFNPSRALSPDNLSLSLQRENRVVEEEFRRRYPHTWFSQDGHEGSRAVMRSEGVTDAEIEAAIDQIGRGVDDAF